MRNTVLYLPVTNFVKAVTFNHEHSPALIQIPVMLKIL
jgi:hypothetical protein